jgi:hypothetical protein
MLQRFASPAAVIKGADLPATVPSAALPRHPCSRASGLGPHASLRPSA